MSSTSDHKTIKEFPDLTNKLAAPGKKSLFERQRAEAEAKRAREAAETAAVYEDFVKSFENDSAVATAANSDAVPKLGTTANSLGSRAPAAPPKRHFAPGARASGPGSLGPAPSLSRKRGHDGARSSERHKERRIFAFEDEAPTDLSTALQTSDNEEDDKNGQDEEAGRAASKPTIQLSSLPPGTSPAVIKNLIPSKLKVDAVRIMPSAGVNSVNSSTERKSTSAIVTLAGDTPASDIDTAVSSLQNHYLGWGYNLSISRHLSSAALSTLSNTTPALNSGLSSLPFGAQAVKNTQDSLSRAPPPNSHRGGFAPPSSYGSSYTGPRHDGRGALQVKVTPPSDIKQLKLIHKTLESLLTHGPEFEALLMSRPEVQKEEKWAWIWNPRSPGGIWYRWRLWEILTGVTAHQMTRRGRVNKQSYRLFDGAPSWAEPEEPLPFEFSTQLSELVSDSDYNSSDEDDSDDAGPNSKRRRQLDGRGNHSRETVIQNGSGEEQAYLNPLHKAKLTYLLARLPPTTAKLRKGDVARVTAFAISHAEQGAEEVVDMLVDNVVRPFAWSKQANREFEGSDEHVEDLGDEHQDDRQHHEFSEKKEHPKVDTSGAALIALHLISDILSASSTSGVRHAWRYRSLFESVLTLRSIFPYLGRMEKTYGWGRLRADKWRRSVNVIMQLWEGWCVFPAGTQERFVEEFSHPPLTEKELRAEEESRRKEREDEASGSVRDSAKSKWKAVDPNDTAVQVDKKKEAENLIGATEDADDRHMEDLDGEPMEDLDGEPMEDIDGESMDDVDGEPMDDINEIPAGEKIGDKDIGASEVTAANAPEAVTEPAAELETFAAKARRQRPKAEDMFADSEEE